MATRQYVFSNLHQIKLYLDELPSDQFSVKGEVVSLLDAEGFEEDCCDLHEETSEE